METEPILNGPPGLVILALVLAVAAYLRQISATAAELRDRIAGGEVWNYPIEEPMPEHTRMKLSALERTHKSLDRAAPYIIVLAIVAAARFLIFSFLVLPMPLSFWPKTVSAVNHIFLPFIDAFIILWLLAIFAVLARMHKRARKKDKEVRRLTREWEVNRNNTEEADDTGLNGNLATP